MKFPPNYTNDLTRTAVLCSYRFFAFFSVRAEDGGARQVVVVGLQTSLLQSRFTHGSFAKTTLSHPFLLVIEPALKNGTLCGY